MERIIINVHGQSKLVPTALALPLIQIDFTNGGSVTVYNRFVEISESWNHFLFEPIIPGDENLTYLIDANQDLFTIQYHQEQIKFPKYKQKITKNLFIDLLERSSLINLEILNASLNSSEIFNKLLKIIG